MGQRPEGVVSSMSIETIAIWLLGNQLLKLLWWISSSQQSTTSALKTSSASICLLTWVSACRRSFVELIRCVRSARLCTTCLLSLRSDKEEWECGIDKWFYDKDPACSLTFSTSPALKLSSSSLVASKSYFPVASMETNVERGAAEDRWQRAGLERGWRRYQFFCKQSAVFVMQQLEGMISGRGAPPSTEQLGWWVSARSFILNITLYYQCNIWTYVCESSRVKNKHFSLQAPKFKMDLFWR